jgi:plastocyanin
MRRVFVFSFMLAAGMLMSACSVHLGLSRILGGGSPSSGTSSAAAKPTRTPGATTTAISISNGHFRPKNLTIKAGTTLTWTNNDPAAASVTSDTPGLFDSGALNEGATFSQTFSSAGTFPYHSTGGTAMYGSITVTP